MSIQLKIMLPRNHMKKIYQCLWRMRCWRLSSFNLLQHLHQLLWSLCCSALCTRTVNCQHYSLMYCCWICKHYTNGPMRVWMIYSDNYYIYLFIHCDWYIYIYIYIYIFLILFVAIICDRLLHQKILPSNNHCPSTHREAINALHHTRLHVHVIHACKKNCILYWKEFANLKVCPKCGTSRYRRSQSKTRVPHKVKF
jgi:hypothetical protein